MKIFWADTVKLGYSSKPSVTPVLCFRKQDIFYYKVVQAWLQEDPCLRSCILTTQGNSFLFPYTLNFPELIILFAYLLQAWCTSLVVIENVLETPAGISTDVLWMFLPCLVISNLIYQASHTPTRSLFVT